MIVKSTFTDYNLLLFLKHGNSDCVIFLLGFSALVQILLT